MKPSTLMLTLIAAALASLVSVTPPAEAASRTWVSGTGNDANSCTRSQPCQTFAAAYALTDAFGEINCLDPGSFSELVLIQKSITISCEAGTAGIIGHGTQSLAIRVQVAASDIVYLRGLDLEGLSTSNAGNSNYGIAFDGVGTLHVEKCLIRGYTGISGQAGYGIFFTPTGAASLFVADTVIANNGSSTGGNVLIGPTGGGLVNVALENVKMVNGTYGMRVADNASATVHASVRNSIASGNSTSGFSATTTGGRLTMLLEHAAAVNNGTVGLLADGANTELHLSNSQLYGNGTGVSATNSALLVSYKNNEIKLNGSNGSPTTLVSGD